MKLDCGTSDGGPGRWSTWVEDGDQTLGHMRVRLVKANEALGALGIKAIAFGKGLQRGLVQLLRIMHIHLDVNGESCFQGVPFFRKSGVDERMANTGFPLRMRKGKAAP